MQINLHSFLPSLFTCGIEKNLQEVRLCPARFPCGFLIPFADGWFGLKSDVPEKVKEQIYSAAVSYQSYGIPHTDFRVDHLDITDMVLLYRILAAYQQQVQEPILQVHLKIIEKRLSLLSLESFEKQQTVLATLQNACDSHLNALAYRISVIRTSFINEPLFDPVEEWGIIQKWRLDPALLVKAPGLATFLYKTSNLKHMATFYGKPSLKELFPYDGYGNPLLKVEGYLLTWQQFKQWFCFNPYSQGAVHRFSCQMYHLMHSERGFVPYLMGNKPDPIHKLSEQERVQLLVHARKFYGPSTPEWNPGEKKTCVLQVVTVLEEPKSYTSEDTSFLHPPHVSLGLIDEQGNVFSWGLEVDLGWLFGSFASIGRVLATSETKLLSPDPEIFKKGDGRVRRVTSIPITAALAEKLLVEAETLNREGVRHEGIKQNCADLVLHFLKMAGHEIDNTMSIGECAVGMLSNVRFVSPWIAGMRKIYDYVRSLFVFLGKNLPGVMVRSVQEITYSVMYIPSKIVTVLENLAFLPFGITRKRHPLRQGQKEEPISNKVGLKTFSAVFRYPSDLFNEKIPILHHSASVAQWQGKQASTIEYRYKGTRLCVAP